MTVSSNTANITGELLRLIAKTGQNMKTAVVVYKDKNNDVYWYGSDGLEKRDAIDLLERVKIELMNKS